MRVLVVEDDMKMRGLLGRGLEEEGMAADLVGSAEEALGLARAGGVYDVAVLDVMLPGMDGLQTCRSLRADGVGVPILLLTALGAVEDRIRGLESGADDYLVKPFSFGELAARLRALARRGGRQADPVLRAGDLRVDTAACRAWRGEEELELSSREMALLEAFMRRPGETMSRLVLLEEAWDPAQEHRSNVVDVYVRYLREKIDRPFGLASLETVRGRGYRLREDGGR